MEIQVTGIITRRKIIKEEIGFEREKFNVQ